MGKSKHTKRSGMGRKMIASSETKCKTLNLCRLMKQLNKKKLETIKWLQRLGMLNRAAICDDCGKEMNLVECPSTLGNPSDGYEWKCSSCQMSAKSLREGTVFQCSKLSLQKIIILTYFWAYNFPSLIARRELMIRECAVSRWYLLCQEACMDALIENNCKTGGKGRNIEIFESKLGERLINNYRTPAGQQVIGVIDVDNGNCFIRIVNGDRKTALLTLLKDNIKNGTTLHSASWRTYGCHTDEEFSELVKNRSLILKDQCDDCDNTFKKLHLDVRGTGINESREFLFGPALCARIYKNAKNPEKDFFIKFLEEIGSLYQKGTRYEMTNQTGTPTPEPNLDNQHQDITNHFEDVESLTVVAAAHVNCVSEQENLSETAKQKKTISVGEQTDASNVAVVVEETVKPQQNSKPERSSLSTDGSTSKHHELIDISTSTSEDRDVIDIGTSTSDIIRDAKDDVASTLGHYDVDIGPSTSGHYDVDTGPSTSGHCDVDIGPSTSGHHDVTNINPSTLGDLEAVDSSPSTSGHCDDTNIGSKTSGHHVIVIGTSTSGLDDAAHVSPENTKAVVADVNMKETEKETEPHTDVVNIDDADSDVEVVEIEEYSTSEVTVLNEITNEAASRNLPVSAHERRILIDGIPSSLSKAELRAYFINWGKVVFIKILPDPVRSSLRYAVLQFTTKDAVNNIQAARPHHLESGLELVTHRGSSLDVNLSLHTRLEERVIVEAKKNAKLTPVDVQEYFERYGRISYPVEELRDEKQEKETTSFTVVFVDYDSADLACIYSPHIIKGVDNVICRKVHKDEIPQPGTEEEPICLDSDEEMPQTDGPVANEPTVPKNDEKETPAGTSDGGGRTSGTKRPSQEEPTSTPKKSNSHTPQNTMPVKRSQLSLEPRAGTDNSDSNTIRQAPYGNSRSSQRNFDRSHSQWGKRKRQYFRNPSANRAYKADATQPPGDVTKGTPAEPVPLLMNTALTSDPSVQAIVATGAMIAAVFQQNETLRHQQQQQNHHQQQGQMWQAQRWQRDRRPSQLRTWQALPPQQWPQRQQGGQWGQGAGGAAASLQQNLLRSVPLAANGVSGPSHVTRTFHQGAEHHHSNGHSFIPRPTGHRQRF